MHRSGLRKFPTLVVNLMLPFGNMTVVRTFTLHTQFTSPQVPMLTDTFLLLIHGQKYMKLPRWFGDWSNIPEEKDEDSPDVKAMKVFELPSQSC
jgi:hypothetical protein